MIDKFLVGLEYIESDLALEFSKYLQGIFDELFMQFTVIAKLLTMLYVLVIKFKEQTWKQPIKSILIQIS